MRVTDILAGGWQTVRRHPKAVAIWGALYLLLAGLAAAWIWPMMPALIEFQAAAAAAQARAVPPPPPEGFVGTILAINLITLLVFAAIFAAAVRATVSDVGDAFGFVRIGLDELRLIGLMLLLMLIGFAGIFGLTLALILVAGLFTVVLGQGAMVVAIPLYSGLIAIIVWAQVRISLAGALTVLRGRIVVREAWRATGGRFWTLFGAYLVLGLAYMATGIVMLMLLNPELLSIMLNRAPDPATVEAAVAAQQQMLFGPRMIVVTLIGAVINTVGLAWGFGAVATAAIGFDRLDHGTTA